MKGILGAAFTASGCFDPRSTSAEKQACHSLKAKPYLTSHTSKFGSRIEGATVNSRGDFFGVNFGSSDDVGQLGQILPEQKLIYKDNVPNTYFNSLRFFNSTTAFTGDTKNHRVLQLNVDPNTNLVTSSSVFCSDPAMLEPNDLVISKTGFIFTSGMRYVEKNTHTDGDIWVCSPQGVSKRHELLGRTNGIELSPNEDVLYVTESDNIKVAPFVRKVWKYNVNKETGGLSNKTLFIDFIQLEGSFPYDTDGMRTDTHGNLFITRHGKGEVVAFNPHGQKIATISLSFIRPTNLEFGGPNGSTLYIVGQCPEFETVGEGSGCVDYIELGTVGAGYLRVKQTAQ